MKYLSISLTILAAGLTHAQDMPLHEIIKPGEDWKAHDGSMPGRSTSPYSVDGKNRVVQLDRGGGSNPDVLTHSAKEPTACTVALGGSTLLVTDAADRYVWAFRIEKDGTLGAGDRYCRLKVNGDERRKKSAPAAAFRVDPSAILVDASNRTYVATSIGIQVFDPTGRLCGVFTAPPGRITELAFEGNKLYARTADNTYLRVMLAEGRKN